MEALRVSVSLKPQVKESQEVSPGASSVGIDSPKEEVLEPLADADIHKDLFRLLAQCSEWVGQRGKQIVTLTVFSEAMFAAEATQSKYEEGVRRLQVPRGPKFAMISNVFRGVCMIDVSLDLAQLTEKTVRLMRRRIEELVTESACRKEQQLIRANPLRFHDAMRAFLHCCLHKVSCEYAGRWYELQRLNIGLSLRNLAFFRDEKSEIADCIKRIKRLCKTLGLDLTQIKIEQEEHVKSSNIVLICITLSDELKNEAALRKALLNLEVAASLHR